MSAAVGTHSGAGPLSLMSCVRESSPLQDFDSDTEKSVSTKKRFWNPKKWFRRKNKASSEDLVVVEVTEIGKDALRSRSTSELSINEEGRRRSSSSMHPGLSVSHDSVFHSPNSGSDMELDAAQSSSPLSISQPLIDLRLQSELSERLRIKRGRGDNSEDDEGLPHSPCNSPTASDGQHIDKTVIKDIPTKSHSTCSDGSLLSMGSYDDDESFEPVQFRHSSKISLQEKKANQDSYAEFGLSSTTTPLNHSAAHHRVSVKPKRTHGAPRRNRPQQLSAALPVTPEVNEDSSIRSLSPEVLKKESLIELYSMSSSTLTDTQLKCSSLPPGLTPPGSADSNKLNRSKSNAGSKSQDLFSQLPEDSNEKEEKLSLLERIFPRKSGRKKKKEGKEKVEVASIEQDANISRQEHVTDSVKSHSETTTSVVTKVPIPAPRSGAASRQRIVPMDITETTEESNQESIILPEKTLIESTSPLQVELEHIFQQRQISLSTSPTLLPKSFETPPPSPKSPVSVRQPKSLHSPNLPTVISSKYDYSHVSRQSVSTKCTESKTKSDDIRHKLKLPALSSLQQRVLSLNEDDTDTNSFMSLTDFQTETKIPKLISKSHSFKAVKHQSFSPERSADDVKSRTAGFLDAEKREDYNKTTITKAASLDSVQNFVDQMTHLSEVNIELKKQPTTTTTTDQRSAAVEASSITISGPSHTAVVNVSSQIVDDFTSSSKNQTSEQIDGSTTISIKEQQISVTKIKVKRETTQVTQSSVQIPEFLNKQLNRVESKPSSNVILTMMSPKIQPEEQNRPKTLFPFEVDADLMSKPPAPRKFSKDNVEIIEKEDTRTPSPKTPSFNRFKSVDSRKSSVTSVPESPTRERAGFKSKSASLDSLNDTTDNNSSQDSLDKLEVKARAVNETVVVLRKKSVGNKKNEEEPELMKVFARRSLKVKDGDIDALQESLDQKTRDSDKENHADNPVVVDDGKKTFSRSNSTQVENVSSKVVEDSKEIVTETKTSPVVLRRTLNNNNIFVGQRAVTVNSNKTSSDLIIKKQMGFSEHRKTDQWISNMKNEEVHLKQKLTEEDILNSGTDFIMEPKNFNQRKAEWEKRAQQGQKKSTP